jgi:hypothetical protein
VGVFVAVSGFKDRHFSLAWRLQSEIQAAGLVLLKSLLGLQMPPSPCALPVCHRACAHVPTSSHQGPLAVWIRATFNVII